MNLAKLALWAAVTAWAAGAGAAELKGTITDTGGSPLPGTNVTVTGGGLEQPRGAVSDARGRYAVPALPPGTYEIRVTHIGYRTVTRPEARVEPAGTTLDFELEAAVIDLEQSVVSASRRREKALDAPASISIVEAAEIQARPALSVSEHVRDQPGVDFARTGLVQSNVVARGFNNVFSGALLTMTDNRIARVPSLRLNAQNFIPVTNQDIERIEVVLGPGSALYGPNSANGVMHIITRSPFNSAGTSVSVGGGERSLASGSIRHAGVVGPYLGYKVSAQYYTGNDWEFVDPEEVRVREQAIGAGADADDLLIGAREEQVERASLEARVDVRPSDDLTAIYTFGYNRGTHVEQTGLGAGQAKAWTYNFHQVRAVYRDLFVQYYRNLSDAKDTYLLRTGEPIVDKSTLDVFQAQHAWGLGDRQRFTYGLDAQFTRPSTGGTITGDNEEDDDIDEVGLYLQSETGLAPQLDLVLSLRRDSHSRLDEAEISPRAGLVYKPQETQSFRLTWNRAFSTPSTNNLYLDILGQRDVFGLEAFAPLLGYNPKVDVRAQGTYRTGQESGFTFRRGADGRGMYRSSFQPTIEGALQVMGLNPGDPGYAIDDDGYIALDHPVAANVQWGIGREVVLSQLVPQLQLLAPGLIAGMLVQQGMDAETAQTVAQEQAAIVLAALPSLVPEQLPGLTNSLGRLNLVSQGFDPVADATDVPGTESTITQTLEVGYKGILSDDLVVSADVYRTTQEGFVGPLAVETPNVFLDPASLKGALEPALAAQLSNPADADAALAAQVLGALDQISLPGLIEGDKDGSAADELAALFASGAAQIPFGTVSPEQAWEDHPTAVLLSYRNFGDITLYGLDLAFGWYPSETWNLTGTYSLVSEDCFQNLSGIDESEENCSGIDDVALNAARHKFSLGGSWRLPQYDLGLGARWRYTAGFPMNSGVYVGDVEAYNSLDLRSRYDMPFAEGLHLLLSVDNVLDQPYRAFVGAPEVGRLAHAQIGLSF